MANGTVEARMLDLIEEVCDDEVIREERDIDLFEAGLLDSMPSSFWWASSPSSAW